MNKEEMQKAMKQIGEDAVVSMIKRIVRPYAEKYIMDSPNKIDDIMLPFMDQLEKAMIELADDIDGEDNR